MRDSLYLGPAQNEEIASLNLLGHFNKDLSYKNVNIQDIQTLMHSDEMMTKYYGYLNLICYELELYKKMKIKPSMITKTYLNQ
ncbi:MAG: hypothetical protein IPJ13_03075 [Saprospiraceae bacterium]|nr:hypothetical protein [Saprospiraceae bacterium]